MKKTFFSILIFTLCTFTILSPLSVAATENSTPSSGEFMEELNCESALLIHLDSGTVLYEKDPAREVEPVFLTKLMIALLTLETVDNQTLPADAEERDASIEKALNSIPVTAPDYIFDELNRLGSSQPNIKRDETLSVLQLLNLLLVPSGNDAAMVLAHHLSGGNIPAFVDKMNARAKELGAVNTFFTNVHGFHDPEQITTVYDIYRITKPLLAKNTFMKIVEQVVYRLEPTNQSDKVRSYRTTNLMMDNNTGSGYYYRPVKGIKTGRNDDSGFCVATYAIRDNTPYFCVVMGAPAHDSKGNLINTNGAFKDTKALCSWAFSNFETKSIIKKGDSVAQVTLKYAWNQDALVLNAASDFDALLPKSVNPKSILLIPDVPEVLEAPVAEGDVIGTVDIMYAGKKIGTINVVASLSAEKNTMQVVSDLVDAVLESIWLYVGLGVLALGLGIYMGVFFLSNRKNKGKVSRQRNRRY